MGSYGKLHWGAAGSRLFPSFKGALKGENNGCEVKQAPLHGKALKSVSVCSAAMIYENQNQ